MITIYFHLHSSIVILIGEKIYNIEKKQLDLHSSIVILIGHDIRHRKGG